MALVVVAALVVALVAAPHILTLGSAGSSSSSSSSSGSPIHSWALVVWCGGAEFETATALLSSPLQSQAVALCTSHQSHLLACLVSL